MSKTGSYVGAYFDYDTDAVMVWERDETGRHVVPYHSPYYFYVPDEDGEYTSIYGDKLKKLVFDSRDEFQANLRQYPRKFESDIAPLYKVLMNEYYGVPAPKVHYLFLDIEVDYAPELGFSSPENPYAPINAVTLYQAWCKQYRTYAVPPKGWKGRETFERDIERAFKEHGIDFKPHLKLCDTELELLQNLIADIQDSDIMSGWNSEFFDIPYIIKRLERVAPKLLDRVGFRGCRPPRASTVERYGTPTLVFRIHGRTHLDYLELFKKFTFEGRSSYSLANIAAEELDIPKIEYAGTLEQLYKGSHFPNTAGRTWEEAEALPERIDQLNLKRALLLEEIKRRGLGVTE